MYKLTSSVRIWSVHPKYLDPKGLVALWRETLLARNVLRGNTKGYKNHPQLDRFKKARDPVACIDQYLASVYNEATNRGYNFSREKIDWGFESHRLKVTRGQLIYEFRHLLNKLKYRQEDKFNELKYITEPKPHPLFSVVDGEVEAWEKIG